NNLVDGFGRTARKLRISVTDRCNMRCVYCMPTNNTEWFEQESILTFDEIIRIVALLADLGVDRVRLTGGEPLLRPNLSMLIDLLSQIHRIRDIGMTTNGLRLEAAAPRLKDAGLRSVNVSLDTFRGDRFRAINGIDGIEKVLAGIQAAAGVGLGVKINM